MNRRRIITALAVVALAVSIGATAPAAAQFVSNYIGRTFTSNAPSGVNGFACKTNGCRVDLGTGANDYLYSDGTSVVAGAAVVTSAGFYTGNGIVIANSATSLKPTGSIAAGQGSTVPAVKIGNANALNAGDKIAAFYSDNGTTERASISRDGGMQLGAGLAAPAVQVTATTLLTCGAGLEGYMQTVAGAGAVRTKTCVCTYTPTGAVYAWVNLQANNTGTGVGTTTTCP